MATFRLVVVLLVLAAGLPFATAAAITAACEPPNRRAYCNPSLPPDARARDLVRRMSLDDKIGQLANGAAAVPSVGLAAYQWWSEALHGVALSPGVVFDAATPCATMFPQVLATAAAFDIELWQKVAAAISLEARAMHDAPLGKANRTRAGLTFWTPNVNIFRDPRWGRGQETPGECPIASALYAEAFVSAFQAQDMDTSGLRLSACCKHWAAYSLENNRHNTTRHNFDARVSVQDMRDTYEPAFRACVEQGGVSCVMCSYNSVNGVPSCASTALLRDRLRRDWSFDGYVTSDCDAVEDVWRFHNFTKTPAEACGDVLRAGMDLDCGNTLFQYSRDALRKGTLSIADIDAAVVRQLAVRVRLGEWDWPPRKAVPLSVLNSREHQELALTAAERAIVLLENKATDDGVPALPLPTGSAAASGAAAAVQSIAVIGPNANATAVLKGNYFGKPPFLVSVLDGIVARFSNSRVLYEQGCSIAGTQNTSAGLRRAQLLAAKADVVVLVVGLDQTQEAEGRDRVSLALPGAQADLIRIVALAARQRRARVIVVVVAGGPVDLSNVKADPSVHAILWAGYGGQSAGTAVANVLSGAVEPAARLPFSIYPASYASRVSMLDMAMRPNATTGYPGRTYRFYALDDVVYDFGHGLTFARFDYQWLSNGRNECSHSPLAAAAAAHDAPPPSPAPGDVVACFALAVSRPGGDGRDAALAPLTVLYFLSAPGDPARTGHARRQLVGVRRVVLAPRTSTVVILTVTQADVSPVFADGVARPVPGQWRLTVQTDEVLSTTLSVRSVDDSSGSGKAEAEVAIAK